METTEVSINDNKEMDKENVVECVHTHTWNIIRPLKRQEILPFVTT